MQISPSPKIPWLHTLSLHILYLCQDGIFSPAVTGTIVRIWRERTVLFLYWIMGYCAPFLISSLGSDYVVYKALPQTISPGAPATTVCCHLMFRTWHLLQSPVVGVQDVVSTCCCVYSFSMPLHRVPLPSLEFPLRTSLWVFSGNKYTFTDLFFSAIFPWSESACLFSNWPYWNLSSGIFLKTFIQLLAR